jgi:hypothetical protein
MAVLLASVHLGRADNAAFDLSGPRVEVKVSRAGKSLPISQVPNLQPGDRLWVHPLLPGQSVRYLLIVAFLRGSTNPPPEHWFTKAETWNRHVREEGVLVTIPREAEQALLFLAPETGGDYGSLRSAVRGKPGAFVRASQDLQRASLDRSRLDKYLSAVEKISISEPLALHDRSVLLARSLNIKLDQQCFDKPSEQQGPCLTQNTDQLVLDDAHSQSMAATLTSGAPVDLIGAVTATPMARGGYYSPYVGAFVDVARIMATFHTAEYQYIPALALPKQYELNLRLNNPPSFRKPKSVLVVALPPIEPAHLPPLRAPDPNQVFCLEKPSQVLPAQGAPLVFSTDLAHALSLDIQSKSGQSVEVPVTADAARGGFVIDRDIKAGNLDPEVSGTLHGFWGFEAFVGPRFRLRSAHPAKWTIPPTDQGVLITGRQNTISLQSDNACCVEQVTLIEQRGQQLKTSWKLLGPGELEAQVSLEDATAGPATMLIKQFGLAAPDEVPLHIYREAGHLDSFVINAGDQQGVLRGTRLDEVASVELSGIRFAPAGLSRADQKDELRLTASSAGTAALQPDERLVAHVSLKDGRILALPTTIDAFRPRVTLISKNIQPGSSMASGIHLGNQDALPQDGRLFFVLKTDAPAAFPRGEKIEIATADDSFDVQLSVAEGNLVLQDSQTVLGTLDPLKSFGPSAFGPIRFRPVDAQGRQGDWQPLAKLVRLPVLRDIRCPSNLDQQCILSGTNLFLIDSVATDPQFTHTAAVPVGFVDSTLNVPRPNERAPLYLKLRDDPSTISTATLPVLTAQP